MKKKHNYPIRVGQVWKWDGMSRTVTEVDAENNLVRWGDGHSSMLDKCCETLRKWANGVDCGTLQTVVPFCVVGQRYLHGEKLFVIDTIDRELKILTFKDHIGDYFLTEFETRNTSPDWKYLGEPDEVVEDVREETIMTHDGKFIKSPGPKHLHIPADIGAEMDKEYKYSFNVDRSVTLRNGMVLCEGQWWREAVIDGKGFQITSLSVQNKHAIDGVGLWRPFSKFECGDYTFVDYVEKSSSGAIKQDEFRYMMREDGSVRLKNNGRVIRKGQRWRKLVPAGDVEFEIDSIEVISNGVTVVVRDTKGAHRPIVRFEQGDYELMMDCPGEWRIPVDPYKAAPFPPCKSPLISSIKPRDSYTEAMHTVCRIEKKYGEKKMTVDTRIKFKDVEVARMSMRTITNVAQSLAQMFGFYAEIDEAEQKVYFCKGQDLSESNEQEVTPDMIQQLFKEAIEKGENHSAIDFAIKHKILRGGNFEVV